MIRRNGDRGRQDRIAVEAEAQPARPTRIRKHRNCEGSSTGYASSILYFLEILADHCLRVLQELDIVLLLLIICLRANKGGDVVIDANLGQIVQDSILQIFGKF